MKTSQWMAGMALYLALTAAAGSAPRLETASAQWTGRMQPGGEVELQVRLVNRSKETSPGVVCNVLLEEQKIGELHTPLDLSPGAEITLGGKFKLPADLPAKWTDQSPTSALQLRLAPYKVADLSASDVTVEAVSEGMRWTASVTNRGQLPVASVPYRLSWDGQVVQEKKLLESLAPGASREISIVDRRAASPGKHLIALEVDPLGELDDADRSNNRYQLDWHPTVQKADLALREWSVEPAAPQAGLPAKVTFTVANTGEIELYRVPITFKVNGVVEAEKKFYQAVPAQGEAQFSLPWMPKAPGEYKLSLSTGSQTTAAKTVEVAARPGYRLQLVSANVPRRSPEGKEWEFEVAVGNAGTKPGESVKAVLWVDGRRAWSARLPQPLAPGAQASLPLRWTAEQAGQHTLRVEVTAQGAPAGPDANVNQTYTVQVDPAR
jgi:hypothetical protein